MIAICAPDSLLTDLEELNDNIVDLDIVEQMEQDGNLLDVVFMLQKLGQYIDIMKKVEHDLIVNIRGKCVVKEVDEEIIVQYDGRTERHWTISWKLLKGCSCIGVTYHHTSSQIRRIRNVYVFGLLILVKLAHVDSEALATLILNKLYAGIKRAMVLVETGACRHGGDSSLFCYIISITNLVKGLLLLSAMQRKTQRADDMQPVLESMAVFPVYLAIREMTRYSSTQRKGASGFLSSSTAEEVTHGIDDSGLTAIVTVVDDKQREIDITTLFGNMTAGKDVREAIVKETPIAKVDTIELDLSSLASVKKFSTELKSSGRPLNLLIYGNYGAYGQSKLANILRANELTRRLKGASNANVEQNGGLATFAKDCKDD
ncbi:Short-chain dehydrogenase TIC 32, chloroplastic [Capsicum chinense]|nr:Short-chain dehydrogenase TIC 32, chloroplastic [Capsicum chinense]